MQLMAPAVYIDYEIETGSGMPPKPLGIYFEPQLRTVIVSRSGRL